jgi:hypothetical protein
MLRASACLMLVLAAVGCGAERSGNAMTMVKSAVIRPDIHGTSITTSEGVAVDAQMLSFATEFPQDVTLHLGSSAPMRPAWMISYGAGKSSREWRFVPSIVGSVVHFVASSVTVRVSLIGTSTRSGRIFAFAGHGRPVEQVVSHQAGTLPPNGYIDIPLPDLAQTLQVLTTDPASVTVQPRYQWQTHFNSMGPAEPQSAYQIARNMDPSANVYRVINSSAAAPRFEAIFRASM